MNEDFESMNPDEQLKAVETTIDEEIRPMLMMDGGNMEIIDIQTSQENVDIYIRYLGACSGCAAGSGGTLFAIEDILKTRLSEKIRVLPV